MFLLILDSLGGTELLLILVVALIIFGPKKLPQLSRSLGRSLAEFKRASHDFKQTWEREAALAELEREAQVGHAMLPPEESNTISPTVARGDSIPLAAEHTSATDAQANHADSSTSSPVLPPSIRPVAADPSLAQPPLAAEAPANEPTRKRDWL